MSEEHEISDREFLDQIHERLTSSGHGVVIIDVGIYRIGKFIAVIFSLFAFFALFGFGIDVNQVRNEAHEIKLAMEKDRDQIKTNLDEIKEISKESKKLLRGVDNRIESFEKTSNKHLETSMTTFADYIHANAENVEYTTLRDFYQQNVEFAEESELHTVKINMLVRLAQLQWKKDDTGDATENFTRAIDQARSLQEYQLAGDVQMTYAELHNADYHKKRNPSAIKARRLYQNALDSYRQAGFDLGAARAYDGIAQSHYYLDEPVLERKALEESRKLYRSVNIDSEQEYSVVMRLAELASSNDQPELQQSLIAEAVSIAENLGRYELAEDRYLQLARLASGRGAPGEVITQLCFAWQAHERRGQLPDNINERLKSKSRRILPDFKVENCP